jgi:hypothetical protein
MRALGFLVLFALLLALAPYSIIWSVNTLVGTAIPFTFATWLATTILVGFLSGVRYRP